MSGVIRSLCLKHVLKYYLSYSKTLRAQRVKFKKIVEVFW